MHLHSWIKKLLRVSLWLGAMTTVVLLVDYAMDAHTRAEWLPKCQWEDFKPVRYPHPYLARWCFVKREMIVVRLFDETGQKLLAERTFEYPTFPRMYWQQDEFGFLTSSGAGGISLPPTLLDRLRLSLP